MILYACDPSSWEAKAGRVQVPGQPRLHSKTLSQKQKVVVTGHARLLRVCTVHRLHAEDLLLLVRMDFPILISFECLNCKTSLYCLVRAYIPCPAPTMHVKKEIAVGTHLFFNCLPLQASHC
jgi:hypothetical protein